MLELYGKQYARNDREFTDSLFNPNGTANGFYKVTAAGIYFSDMQGNERAFIRRDGLGPVTVTRANGLRFYMFSACETERQWLGIPESYAAACNGAESLARSVFPKA